jgi:anti-sigma factor ChrR (cupin superfamily)
VSEHVADHLPELALGVLDASLKESVLGHLEQCPSCAAWLAELKAGISAPGSWQDTPWPRHDVPDVEPPLPLAALALKTIPNKVSVHSFRDVRVGELARFKGRIAELFAIPQVEAAQALVAAEGQLGWIRGPAKGIHMLPIASPLEGALTVIVRAKPEAVFPRHRHTGDEWSLVLQGALESNGQRYWRGDRLSQRAGSVHDLTALPGATCLCAVRAMGELDFG